MQSKVFYTVGGAFFQLFLWFITVAISPRKKYCHKETFLPVLQSKPKTISQIKSFGLIEETMDLSRIQCNAVRMYKNRVNSSLQLL